MTDSLDIVDEEKLLQIGNYVKEKAKALAPSFVAPWLTKVEIERAKDGKYGIKLGVDLQKIPEGSRAKSARAYEYGSGVHNKTKFKSRNQESPKSTIKIEPKNKQALAFPWQVKKPPLKVGGRVKKVLEGDRVVIHPFVNHPGVKAVNNEKGYLRESLRQSKDYIADVLGEDAVKKVKLKVRAVFSRPGGKNK